MKIPFVGGSYAGRSKNINSQRCVNWFPCIDQEGGKSPVFMLNTPGLVEWYDFSSLAPIRGMHVYDSLLWVVIGNTLYSITSDSVATERGTITSSAGPVQMEHNQTQTQLMLVDGSTGYIWDGATLTEIADGDFPGAGTLTFQDGYFIISEPSTGKFWISALNDGTDWTATDFTTASGKSDNLIAVKSFNEELWALGAESAEIYYNSGNADFPFTRLPKGVLEFGLGAAGSVAVTDSAMYLLDDNLLVRQINGYEGKIVSTPQIAYQFEQYATTSDAIGFTYQQERYDFYVLTFPSAQRTWVYCETTEFWHEWNSYPNYNRHRSNCYAWFNNKHLVGDWNNGKIYRLDLGTYTDDGNEIRRIRTAMAVHEDRKLIFHRALEIDFEGGVGIATGQGDDPQAMLKWSDDSGHTWSNEYWADIGKIGRHDTRTRWRRLGRSRERIYNLTISDPVKAVIIGAHLDAGAGIS